MWKPHEEIGDVLLAQGDVLLVQGPREEIGRLKSNGDFLVLDATVTLPRTEKAPVALAIMIAVVAFAATGVMPIAVSATAGAVAMLLTGCLGFGASVRAISPSVFFVVVASLALGKALDDALGDRAGITRFGAAQVPLDEALSRVIVDASDRPYLVWKVVFQRPKLGDMDSELFKEWFQAFAQNAGLTLHVENFYGENDHHIVETCFKGLARALRQAIALDARLGGAVPSTKGVLGSG